MNLRQSSKKQAKIKLALQGCAGSGKTYSALLLANGLCRDWTKIAVIDSENGSADLYAHLGNYNVLPLQDNFTPESYIEAIQICESAGMQVIILDSISQCWDNLLEYHGRSARQQFHQLAEDYSQNERLHAEDIAVRQAHHLHHALQTGLCAQREEWQDGA